MTGAKPFVAVCYDGRLDVTTFDDGDDALRQYELLREEFKDSGTFEESPADADGQRSFSVDSSEGPSVALGTTVHVRRKTRKAASRRKRGDGKP